MKLIGHGIDLVEVSTIERLLTTRQDDFLDGNFTQHEREIAKERPSREQYFAGRCAAKEAVAKALGTGFTQGVTWQDIEVRPTQAGAPIVILTGRALEIALQLGITRWSLSISDTPRYAVASAIAILE